MLWQARKKLRQLARQRIQNLDVKSASRRQKLFGFFYYFVGWNLVGGVLVYLIFYIKDPKTGRKGLNSPEELRAKFYGPRAYVIVEDEEGKYQQKRNPAFDQWLAEKDAELARRKKELYKLKEKVAREQ